MPRSPDTLSALSLVLTPQRIGALGSMIGAVGTAAWFDRVLDFLGTITPIDSGGAMVFHRQQRPRRIVHRYIPEERALPEDAFLGGPYALDPNYQLFLQGCPSGVYWLRQIAPEDFYDSEYYRVFYSQIGLSDSIDLLWRIDDDTALNIFLERSYRHSGFGVADQLAMEAVAPLVWESAQRHHTLTARALGHDPDTLTHRKVQSTIERFGASVLTPRERQVLFYVLSGYSAAQTAQRLDTSEGTIKIHRKNIYRKLDIGSQAELFALFIHCIGYAQPDSGADPLQAYQSTPQQAPQAALLPVPAPSGKGA